MPSLSPKDRVSLCLFSFTDGRRCRTPRTGRHPHFCFYHAQKEARVQAAEKLGKDLAYFFSGDYLSACDLSTALARLIPAVIRGDIKPKLARTVAYMVQSLTQTIHLSQDEYINAFSTDGWRKAVRNSVNLNSDYDNPQPEQAEADDTGEPEQSPAQPQVRPPAQPQQPAQAPPQSPAQLAAQTPVGAGLARPSAPAQPATSGPSAPQPRNAARPSTTNVEAALSVARSLFPPHPNSASPQSAPTEACHPERSEGPRLNPAPSTSDETRLASAPAQSTQPNNAPPPAPPCPQPRATTPNRDPYAVHFDHSHRLRADGKLV